jgi:drug/metabolite transporter (DMT)-like permease
MTRPLSDWLLLGSLVAVWGTSFLVIDVAVETVPALSVAAGRIVSAAMLLLGALLATGRRLPRGRVWAHYLALALMGNCLPFFLIGWGQERITSGLAGILMGVMPLTTLLLAHFFVPGEFLTRRNALGFVFGFGGVVVLTGPEALLELGGSPSELARQLAVLGGAVCYAINAVLARHLPPTDALVASATTLLLAAFVIAPLALAIDRPLALDVSGTSLAAVLWLGIVTTALATIVYYRLIASAGPTFFSYINFLIPIVALACGVALLGEPASARALLALALVLSGLAISQGGRAVRPGARPGRVALGD